MTKALFILEKLTKEKVNQVTDLGANAIFTSANNLSNESSDYLNNWRGEVFAEVGISQGEDFWQKYPDSRPLDRSGRPINKINWYAGVCPNNPGVRKTALASINRLIKAYYFSLNLINFL